MLVLTFWLVTNNRPSLISTQRRLFVEGAGLWSVPRSHCWYRPQARRFNPADFTFGFGGFGKLLLLLRLALGRRWRSRPTKSGGPSLLEPSLKVQGNAHNRNSGFAVLPQCDDLNAHRIRKVPRSQRNV
jgi:hypothetical protein